MANNNPQPRDLSDYFLSQGRYVFSKGEAVEVLGSTPNAVAAALTRLRRRKEILTIGEGVYAAVPPEYRSWGVVPAEWFIDDLMRHLKRPYYVALLSAARLHGSSHQAPQIFQVITTGASIRDRDFGRVRIRFYASQHVEKDKTVQLTTQTGYVVVAGKETTVVDLIAHPRDAGGYGNVATIIKEIGKLDGDELARVASRRGRAAVRRTGWFVERFGEVEHLEALCQAARVDLGHASPLDPSAPRRGKTDPSWSVRVNTTVEADL